MLMEEGIRSTKIVELTQYVFEAICSFQEIYRDFRKEKYDFQKIASFIDDKGESVLFEMKEICHFLFRINQEHKVSDSEQLLDITISALFHLAMKIREDVYQELYYVPKFKKIMAKKKKSNREKDLIQHFKKLQLKTNLMDEMEEAQELMKDVEHQFLELLPVYRENGLLVRFLFENAKLINKALGKGGQASVLESLYNGNMGQIYFVAAISYLESGFYNKTVEMFSKIKKDEKTSEIIFYQHLAKGLMKFFEEEFQEMVAEFDSGLRQLPEAKTKTQHLQLMNNFLHEILVLGKFESSSEERQMKEDIRNLTSQIESFLTA